MGYEKGMHPGAVWKRTDFQIHTPRDAQWTGSPALPGGTPENEEARQEWARSFVEKCRTRGLTAIAITDHHDYCFVDYVKKAAEELSQFWVYPGVEVTCADAVQCLILFDTTTNAETWSRLFGGHLQRIPSPAHENPQAPQTIDCGRTLEDFIDCIASDPQLNQCSIILPHGTDSGHKGLLRRGFHNRFRDLSVDGVYTEKPWSALAEAEKRKIYGEASEWGSRRRGIIPTGDNRSESAERLGAHECWVRLGEPTTEAIRQAVLADEARISYTAPTLPLHRILELRVNSSLTGSDFRLHFNDGFTAMIGGRGSGKSATLEYLLFGLGRSITETVSSEDSYRNRDRSLVHKTLQDGFVSVVLERDGVQETWTRSWAARDKISISVEDEAPNETVITTEEARRRFQARGFHQKQLSTLVADPKHAAEQITGIAAAELISQRRELEHDLNAKKREVQTAFQRVIELWNAQEEMHQHRERVKDLKRRALAVKNRLREAGLAPEDQQILEAAPGYKLVSGLIQETPELIDRDIENLRSQFGSLSSLDTHPWEGLLEQFPELPGLISAITDADSKLKDTLETSITALQTLRAAHTRFGESFTQKYKAFGERHRSAVELQANTKALVEEAEHIDEELRMAELGERRSQDRVKQLTDAQDRLHAAREKLQDTVDDLYRLMAEAAAKVDGMSAGTLRAIAFRETKPGEYLAALLAICERNHIRDAQQKCEDRIEELAADSSALHWTDVCDNLLAILQGRIKAGIANAEPSDELRSLVQETLLPDEKEARQNALYASVDEGTVLQALTATPETFISFEYKDARGYIPFEQASPGQQSSAILKLLLNQEAGTLIVDQPEDDLDNKVIIEIAQMLQKTKRKRQLIFATHNPNFVVNGDADKVVALQSGSGSFEEARVYIEVDGAIETPLVRESITQTMEGGQKAFELRSRKYRFPLGNQ